MSKPCFFPSWLLTPVFILAGMCIALGLKSQRKPDPGHPSLKKGVKITITHRLDKYPDVVCNKTDSILIAGGTFSKHTIYIRGNQLRIEKPDNSWGAVGNEIITYPGKNDLDWYACSPTRYFNAFVHIDPSTEQLIFTSDRGMNISFDSLPDTATISGYKCYAGILNTPYADYLVYYTKELPAITSPHRTGLLNEWVIPAFALVPGFIVQSSMLRDWSNRNTHLHLTETVESVEFMPLRDSLFRPPSGYQQFHDWEEINAEYLRRWEAEIKAQEAANPVSAQDKEAFFGHWVCEDDYGIYYLSIKPNPSPERYGDTCFVKDFMFRKMERSSGTIGNWRARRMGNVLFHEFSRSWTYDKATAQLIENGNERIRYRRATPAEEATSMEECRLVWAAWDMADSLDKWGYARLMVDDGGRMADSIWNSPDGEEILKRVAYRSGSTREQRFLAAEIIFRKDPAYPPEEDTALIADLSYAYANALEYDYAPDGSYWGSVPEGTTGFCGAHLLRLGKAAIPELTSVCINQSFDFYLHYPAEGQDYENGPRKKDHAALLISILLHEPYTFHEDKAVRDAGIEILRTKLDKYKK